jgi:hypothetical protein
MATLGHNNDELEFVSQLMHGCSAMRVTLVPAISEIESVALLDIIRIITTHAVGFVAI